MGIGIYVTLNNRTPDRLILLAQGRKNWSPEQLNQATQIGNTTHQYYTEKSMAFPLEITSGYINVSIASERAQHVLNINNSGVNTSPQIDSPYNTTGFQASLDEKPIKVTAYPGNKQMWVQFDVTS